MNSKQGSGVQFLLLLLLFFKISARHTKIKQNKTDDENINQHTNYQTNKLNNKQYKQIEQINKLSCVHISHYQEAVCSEFTNALSLSLSLSLLLAHSLARSSCCTESKHKKLALIAKKRFLNNHINTIIVHT